MAQQDGQGLSIRNRAGTMREDSLCGPHDATAGQY